MVCAPSAREYAGMRVCGIVVRRKLQIACACAATWTRCPSSACSFRLIPGTRGAVQLARAVPASRAVTVCAQASPPPFPADPPVLLNHRRRLTLRYRGAVHACRAPPNAPLARVGRAVRCARPRSASLARGGLHVNFGVSAGGGGAVGPRGSAAVLRGLGGRWHLHFQCLSC